MKILFKSILAMAVLGIMGCARDDGYVADHEYAPVEYGCAEQPMGVVGNMNMVRSENAIIINKKVIDRTNGQIISRDVITIDNDPREVQLTQGRIWVGNQEIILPNDSTSNHRNITISNGVIMVEEM